MAQADILNDARLPPANREAEQCVLGSMLRDNSAIDDVARVVRPEDFYHDAHRKVFQAVVKLHGAGGPADAVLLAEELKRRGWFEDAGGYSGVADLWDAAPTAANAAYYAGIVRDKALLRGLIRAGHEILAEAYAPTTPADQIVERAERLVFALAEGRLSGADE